MNEKVLITGGTGLLGTDLALILKHSYRTMPVSSVQFDIRKYDDIISFFKNSQPGIVLHAAAWADVDACEKDKEKAMAINADGAGNIARACKKIGARMIYYSTDYVFDGQKGAFYVETDETNPVNIYGLSKLEGEKRVLDILDDAAVMRISWLFGTARDNFVTRTLKDGRDKFQAKLKGEKVEPIQVIHDQKSCPTWTIDIADQTKAIIENKLSGIIHAASTNEASRYDLADMIFEEVAWDLELQPMKMSDYNFVAPRPPRTPLENKRLNDSGLSVMRDYREALREFLMVYQDK